MKDPRTPLDTIHSAGGCLARVGYGTFAALYLLATTIAIWPAPSAFWTISVAALTSVAVIIWRRAIGWAVAAASVSLLATLFIALARPHYGDPSVAAEVGGMLILLVRTVWKASRERLIPPAVLVAGSVLAVPLRGEPLAAAVLAAPMGVLVSIALGIGLYLRALDARRARTLAGARRDERLELARDLHDFVAHHVTGIVVQAQAARFAAGSGAAQNPEQLDKMFAGIEKAGTEALTSMRRMVGLLRDAQNTHEPDGEAGRSAHSGDRGSTTRPVGDLAQLEELVGGFTDPPATLWMAPDLGTLPAEAATSVHRVVQEALTNVRKHAADATTVRVTVARTADGSVEVAVRNDGQGRGRRLPSSGFGLSGLGERVHALGGRLYTGPRPEGGWEVVAVLPVQDS